jgi:hypothetical protein
MQRFSTILMAITILAFGEIASAQQGRFLKRLRDEIRGMTQPQSKSTPAQNPQKDQRGNRSIQSNPAYGRQPTPAEPRKPMPPGGEVPTPAASGDNSLYSNFNRKYSNDSLGSSRRTDDLPIRGSASNTDFFGFTVVENGENVLVVNRVDPNGNAAKAGIRPGDTIVGAGGLNEVSLKDFEEITNVLNHGDQLEIKVSRDGIEKELMVQFGKTPAASDLGESNDSQASDLNRRIDTRQSEPEYDFAPARSTEATESVLDGPRNTLPDPDVHAHPSSNFGNEARSYRSESPDVRAMINKINEQQQTILKLQQEIERLRAQVNRPGPVNTPLRRNSR